MLQWTPQSQFAGYYVAREKGMFRERGLDVEIIRGGPDRDPVRNLEEGKTDFAVIWLVSALVAADRGLPIVHTAQLINSSHLSLVAWKEKGIYDVKHLQGRKVAVWEGALRHPFTALFRSRSIEPVVVPQYSTINLFLLKGVDALSVMDYNEYHRLYQAGIDESELSRFRLKDLDVDFPEDGLYCLRRLRDADPDTCRSLAAAVLAGWEYAAKHEEEALGIVMKEVSDANLPTNRAHMRHMLRTVIPTIIPAEGATWKAGVLSREAYERAARKLLDLGEIRRIVPHDEFAG
jgi:NitT/TauT family transport system substrate-binding protein